MKLEDILAQLEESIADQRLSDAEKQTLTHLLREVSPPEEGLRRLRNAAFDLVRQRLDGPSPYELLKWLEGVVRCIDTFRTPPMPVQAVAYFSPGLACRKAIIQRLDQARKKVDLCVFTIADDPISEAIRQVHKRGVPLRIITDDAKMADAGSDIDLFRRTGIPVAEDSPEGHMHHKFALIDGLWLITGSYNWTRSAALDNDENVVETNDPALVRQFTRQFELLWEKYAP